MRYALIVFKQGTPPFIRQAVITAVSLFTHVEYVEFGSQRLRDIANGKERPARVTDDA